MTTIVTQEGAGADPLDGVLTMTVDVEPHRTMDTPRRSLATIITVEEIMIRITRMNG